MDIDIEEFIKTIDSVETHDDGLIIDTAALMEVAMNENPKTNYSDYFRHRRRW